MKTRLILAIALLLVCAGAGAARAQGTPDGLPPAMETVCDMEQGSAFGHCNAYCEAMDCDSDNPQASATACDKVRNKFQQTTGRDVPCEVSCPCTSLPQFNAALAEANFCREDEASIAVSPFAVLTFPGAQQLAGTSKPGDPSQVCIYANTFPIELIALPITSEQAAACVELIRDAVADRGVICTPDL